LKIIFNLMNVGLGQNGGSQTIIKSANILQKLGHEITIIDSGKNQHKWTPLEVKHIIIKNIEQIPDADIIIGTGFKSWENTLNLPDRCGKKFVYIRGWELRQAPEYRIIEVLSNKNIIKIVNSIGLQNKLKNYNIESYIIRPGNDFEDFEILNIKKPNKNIIIGGLWHTRHRTKRSSWILETTKVMKQSFGNKIKLHMFGTDKNPNIPIIDKYLCQPSLEEKNKFYNNINIWLAPSNLEGLHIVPQEVMIQSVPVVTTNALLAGTSDYIIHNETGLMAKDNSKSFCKQTRRLIKNKDLRQQLGKEGRKKIIELGNREENMKRMISLFEKFSQKVK